MVTRSVRSSDLLNKSSNHEVMELEEAHVRATGDQIPHHTQPTFSETNMTVLRLMSAEKAVPGKLQV